MTQGYQETLGRIRAFRKSISKFINSEGREINIGGLARRSNPKVSQTGMSNFLDYENPIKINTDSHFILYSNALKKEAISCSFTTQELEVLSKALEQLHSLNTKAIEQSDLGEKIRLKRSDLRDLLVIDGEQVKFSTILKYKKKPNNTIISQCFGDCSPEGKDVHHQKMQDYSKLVMRAMKELGANKEQLTELQEILEELKDMTAKFYAESKNPNPREKLSTNGHKKGEAPDKAQTTQVS